MRGEINATHAINQLSSSIAATVLSTSYGNGVEPAEHVLVAGSQGSAHHVVETSASRTRIAFL